MIYEQGGNLYKLNSDTRIKPTPVKINEVTSMQPSEKIKNDPKIFISHAWKDKLIDALYSEVIILLEAMGVKSDQIFCTSFEGDGISPGENSLEAIKNELNANTLVLFILSENFYKSRVCLCEMGAAWYYQKNMCQLSSHLLNMKISKELFL